MPSIKWLDKLPAPVRHNVIMLLGFIGSQVQNFSATTFNTKEFVAGLIGVEVAQVILFLTPFTQQYGLFKNKGQAPKI